MLNESENLPELISRGVVDLFPNVRKEGLSTENNLLKRLDESIKINQPLRVKLGIDPTGAEIHLGHTILFRKLRAFQDAGHTAVLIIGDFTARIGDPSGKSKTRIQLSPEQVDANALTYLEQLGSKKSPDLSILDFKTPGRLEVHRNSEWLSKLNLVNVVELLTNATVGQMLAKEEFANRYKKGTSISLHEFLYPLLQGYDSFAVNADIELGGTDQKFNIAMGRDVQKFFDQRPQFGMLLPILTGIDGVQKMSKSLGNTVSLTEDPLSMYSKLEKVPDSSVYRYLELLTNSNLSDLPSNPRELQKFMALTVTSTFYGKEIANSAKEDAAQLVTGGVNLDNNILDISFASISFPVKAFYFLSAIGLCGSSSEARRLIQGGGVRLDGEKICDPNIVFQNPNELSGKVIQIGKKIFRRLSQQKT